MKRGSTERETTNAQKAPCRKGFKERGGKTPQRHQTGRELKERETTSTAKASSGKGARSADYAKRWSMKEIDKTLGCIKKRF